MSWKKSKDACRHPGKKQSVIYFSSTRSLFNSHLFFLLLPVLYSTETRVQNARLPAVRDGQEDSCVVWTLQIQGADPRACVVSGHFLLHNQIKLFMKSYNACSQSHCPVCKVNWCNLWYLERDQRTDMVHMESWGFSYGIQMLSHTLKEIKGPCFWNSLCFCLTVEMMILNREGGVASAAISRREGRRRGLGGCQSQGRRLRAYELQTLPRLALACIVQCMRPCWGF